MRKVIFYPVRKDIAVVILFMLQGSITFAGDLSLTPRITVQELYSDNVSLDSSGAASGEFITEITSGIHIKSDSRRIDLDITYNLQNVVYSGDGRHDIFHLLDIKSSSELIEDHGFVDLTLRLQPQVAISGNNNTVFNNLSLVDGRTERLSYRISPSWTSRMMGNTEIELEYVRDEIISDVFNSLDADQDEVDSVSDIFRMTLSNEHNYNNFLWNIIYENEEIDFSSGISSSFESYIGTLEYLFSHKLSFITEVGYENNDFLSSRNSTSGEIWSLGFKWNPISRLKILVSTGQRFFGAEQEVNVSYTSKRSRLELQYSEKVDSSRSRVANQAVFNLTDAFGDPVINPAFAVPALLDVSRPVLSDDIFINKNFMATYRYQLRRNVFLVEIKHQEREFERRSRKEIEDKVSLSWLWTIGRKTFSNLNIHVINSELILNEERTILYVDYNLTRVLSKSMNIALGYQYTSVDSDISLFEFSENRIFASLTKYF